MLAVLVLGGVQLVMIGVLGEYLWRVLDEARARPLYIVERTLGFDASLALRQSDDSVTAFPISHRRRASFRHDVAVPAARSASGHLHGEAA